MKKALIIITIIAVTILTGYLINNTINKGEKPKNYSGQLGQLKSLGIQEVKDTENITIITTAICNSTNYCQDHYIVCKQGKEIKRVKVENASIQHTKNWKDPRKNINYQNLCK